MRSFSDILVYEDVFESSMLKEIYKLTNRFSWGIQSSDENDPNFFWKLILDDEKFITEDCFNQIKMLIGDNYSINTVYLNAQSSLQSGNPHYDSKEDDEYTFLTYINMKWDLQWGGHTIFVSKFWSNEKNRIDDFHMNTHKINTLSFLPLPNCGLFFPSNIVHFAEGPSKIMTHFRFTLAYKLKKINLDI